MAKKYLNTSQPMTQTSKHTVKARSHTARNQAVSQSVGVLNKKQARRDAKQLGLNKADLPNSIKEVITTLTEAGYEAYIVGGGVRDALLGLRPKDFDAVTNATPNQIKDIFGKRCRVIGRRFQLCHVYSGRDMIEVATFRAPPKDDTFTSDEGMLMRDNVWGDIYQDAVRRDFSINALYYQPLDGFVYDFCGGLTDIQNKTLRLLGDAKTRIEEDPVRLLRALRFKAKLGFRFSSDLEKQFNNENWSLITHVSPHRLYDETQKMFTGGYLLPLLPLLFDYRAFEHLIFYPPTTVLPLVESVAINTDKRIHEGKSINPAFFYAAILWENYLFLLDKFKKNMPFAEAQHHAANKVMDKQRTLTAMPKFAEQFIKEIWLLQPRLAEPRRKNIQKLFENPRFRAGFDFLHLREMVQRQTTISPTRDNESTNHMGDWWAWFQTLSAKQQQQAIAEFDLAKVKQRFGNSISHNEKNTKNKSRLSQQEQGEKEQLRQLSLATPSSGNPPKPLWETPESVAENTGGYDLSEFDTPRPSRRERRLANQTLQRQVAQITDFNSQQDEKSQPTHAPTQRTSRLVEPAIPSQRKRRVPSSQFSVIERYLLEKGETLEPIVTTTALENETSTTQTLEPNAVAKKPRTRQPKGAETINHPKVELVENIEMAKPKATRKSKADSTTTEPIAQTASQKIPAKRTRKKVVKPLQKIEVLAEKTVENTEKPIVKRGRKPKVVTENAETLEARVETPSKKPIRKNSTK